MGEKIFVSPEQEAVIRSFDVPPESIRLHLRTGVLRITWPSGMEAFVDPDGQRVRWVELEAPLVNVA
jgi:hypothetical protein